MSRKALKKYGNSDAKTVGQEQAVWTFLVAAGMMAAALLQMKTAKTPLNALLEQRAPAANLVTTVSREPASIVPAGVSGPSPAPAAPAAERGLSALPVTPGN